jgi:hypothetical protein
MKTKRGLYAIVFLIFIILLISTVSAGFFDWFKKTITGLAPQQPQNITITVTGANPVQITYVSPIAGVNPEEANFTMIHFNVTMYDPDGVSDLNDTSVQANFSTEGYAEVRENSTCEHIIDFGNSANYTCSIEMQYWDNNGTWNITVRGRDLGNTNWMYNTTTAFVYNTLRAMRLSPEELTWPSVSSGDTNQTATDDPTVINNTGNYNGTIRMAAINLLGEDNPSQAIYAENFTIDIETGGGACSAETCIECDGTQLQNYSGGSGIVTIVNAIPNPGNLTLVAGSGQEELYYCVTEVPAISSQEYSTLQGGSWTIIYPA